MHDCGTENGTRRHLKLVSICPTKLLCRGQAKKMLAAKKAAAAKKSSSSAAVAAAAAKEAKERSKKKGNKKDTKHYNQVASCSFPPLLWFDSGAKG